MSSAIPPGTPTTGSSRDAEFEDAAMHGLAGGPTDPLKQGHPPGLYLLFVTEMWERFSYYGMRAFLMLFMTSAVLTGGLGWNVKDAAAVYGWYTGLCYLTPMIGGYIADRLLGTHYSMLLGGMIIAAGHFTLAFESMPTFYTGLALIIVGTGFFKPCVSVMVSQLYPARDPRRDSAFTIFYMGINLGAFLGPLICGGLRLGRKTGEQFGWSWAFGAAGVGMVLGLIAYMIGRPFLLKGIGLPTRRTPEAQDPGRSAEDKRLWPALTRQQQLSREEKDGIAVIFIMAFFVIFFWTAFEQAGSSMNLFAEHRTDRSLGTALATSLDRIGTQEGYPAPSYVFALAGAVLTGAWIMAERAAAARGGLQGLTRVVLRLIGLAVGPVLLTFGLLKAGGFLKFAFFPDDFVTKAEYPADWFQSVNPFFILVLAPAFAALWARLGKRGREPSTPVKFALGLLLLGGGFVFMVMGAQASTGKDDSVIKVTGYWLLAAYFAHTVGELCLSPVGLSMVNKLAPIRFVSLLMGVWFLANFAANKLSGFLAGYNEDIEQGKFYRILGGQADFYLLFVVAPVAAGLVLLALAPQIRRMMHGRA